LVTVYHKKVHFFEYNVFYGFKYGIIEQKIYIQDMRLTLCVVKDLWLKA